MAAPFLDNEFMKYWSMLTIAEKESLLAVAKNYVRAKSEEIAATDLRRNLIAGERASYLEGKGESFDWEQIKAITLDSQRSFSENNLSSPRPGGVLQ